MAPWHKPPSAGTQTAFPIPYIKEARLTSFQIRLVSETKPKRIQRRQFRELQAKIFDLWHEYEANQRSAKRSLIACSYLNGPRENSAKAPH